MRTEIEHSEDMVQAAVASSAYTFAYEAVPHEGRLWTDGGIVTNEPIRPALRLGADFTVWSTWNVDVEEQTVLTGI